MKSIKSIFILFSLTLLASCGPTKNTEKELSADAQQAQTEVMNKHPQIAENFANSAGYAIFPNVGKGAYVIGGASGNGVVYKNGSKVGYADLKQLDVGLQAGGKAFIEIIFFQTESALDEFQQGGYELAGNASAVVLEEGVSKSVDFQNGVGVVTMPKAGAMAGVSVGGQRFEYHSAQ
ncbi:Las17-binding protein actin regulator [Salegentibacter echinorum]|uniref:Las17-binding protein actin regulator n=1 Tax=Salegentibacter echinorum TaxID=1073325 RepID=A0A1M5E3T7_SALEC|nr:lipid-binding SYLF domain-containing protein [Salegentibacter echinorum]SHF73721.1 Las17-binding protein actin regulator [Salegentibacter echinorum]